MSISAHDVARELRRQLPGAGVVKIHKLLYYCQGWGLAFTSRPLFGEDIEAWANGPVVATVWADEKHDRRTPPPLELESDARAIISFVVAKYGGLTGKQLIALTHNEAPWREVSERADDWASPTITAEALIDFFGNDEEIVHNRDLVERAKDLDATWERLTTVPEHPSVDDPAELHRRLEVLISNAT